MNATRIAALGMAVSHAERTREIVYAAFATASDGVAVKQRSIVDAKLAEAREALERYLVGYKLAEKRELSLLATRCELCGKRHATGRWEVEYTLGHTRIRKLCAACGMTDMAAHVSMRERDGEMIFFRDVRRVTLLPETGE